MRVFITIVVLFHSIVSFGQVKSGFIAEVNYCPTGDIKEIPEFNYPKVEIDVSGYSEKELKDCEQYTNDKWYKKEARFFQHKPCNHYVQVLKKWDKDAFYNLNKTYLISDL